MTAPTQAKRHALVTGGGSGIGAAIARALAASGCRVTITGRRPDVLQSLAGQYPEQVQGIAMDVTDTAEVAQAFARAREGFGPVHILVNNAGQALSSSFIKTSPALWEQMLSINLTGTFHCTQAVLPDMLTAKWGRIINVASTAGLVGYAYVAAYSAAKHGVVGLTRALALEYARKGITVNAVCPGYTETDILRDSIANVMSTTGRSFEEARAEFTSGNPQGRIVQPEEVADTVRWLSGDAAGSVTGQSIAVCGGEIMH